MLGIKNGNNIEKNVVRVHVVFTIFTCAIAYFSLWMIGNGDLFLYKLNFSFYNQTPAEIIHNLSGILFIFSSGIVGIILLMFFCNMITKYLNTPEFIVNIGKYTLSIYLIQGVFFNAFLKHFDWQLNNDALYFCASILIFCLCVSITYLLSYNKTTSYVFLGKLK